MTGTSEGRRVDAIIGVVCRHYGADRELIISTRTLKGGVAEARHVAMYACWRFLRMSYVDIAHWFDRKEDAVRSGCRKIHLIMRTPTKCGVSARDRILCVTSECNELFLRFN